MKLPPGRQGAIGIPLILSFRTLRWVKRGDLEIGQPAGPFDVAKSNLHFDDDHLVIASSFESRKVLATLDTGAETTDLMSGFAKQFARFLQASGKEDTREIRGLGGAVTYHAVTVPDISFRIGNVEASLRPAAPSRSRLGNSAQTRTVIPSRARQQAACRAEFVTRDKGGVGRRRSAWGLSHKDSTTIEIVTTSRGIENRCRLD